MERGSSLPILFDHRKNHLVEKQERRQPQLRGGSINQGLSCSIVSRKEIRALIMIPATGL